MLVSPFTSLAARLHIRALYYESTTNRNHRFFGPVFPAGIILFYWLAKINLQTRQPVNAPTR